MIKRLRKRFIRISTLAVTAVLFLLCLIVNITNYISVNADLDQILEIISENEGTIPKLPKNGPGKPKLATNDQSPEMPYSTRYFVIRYTSTGKLIQKNLSSIAAVTENDLQDYINIALKQGEGTGFTGNYKFLSENHGNGRYMTIFLDCSQELDSLLVIGTLSIAAMIVCIVLVYVIVVLLSQKAINPVMQSIQKQKQFITDAGHELKTPITVIATSLKVLEMDVGENKWIQKARAQTEHLGELTNALVTLSRLDEVDSPLHFNKFNISYAIGETADAFLEIAQENGHELIVSIAESLEYTGDEYAIRQLASILLDNAIKYTVPDAPIYFTLEKNKRTIYLYTSNPCNNINTADIDKLFDRFFRTDKSRTSNGFGIGLSIARSITEGHKGTISAKYDAAGNLRICAELR